ncbi:MAG TPA: hypothetical protein VKA44_01340 [Gemmatimonadota bacterium]|nr:hypothetical protein [Gemmatimonadota bacterium]
MILPNVRASFGREEAVRLVALLGRGEGRREDRWRDVLGERGLDALLDDPALPARLVEGPPIRDLPLGLVIYVLLRHALLESGVESRMIADYVSALVLEFGFRGRSYRIAEHDDREYHYLVDILADMAEARGRRAFLLEAHLGNLAVWLSGLFPDRIAWRGRRRGGPHLSYYEEMGQTGYRMAAEDPLARQERLDALYRDAAEGFGRVRRGLNRFSDRYMFPQRGATIDRLLRQVSDRFEERGA